MIGDLKSLEAQWSYNMDSPVSISPLRLRRACAHCRCEQDLAPLDVKGCEKFWDRKMLICTCCGGGNGRYKEITTAMEEVPLGVGPDQ